MVRGKKPQITNSRVGRGAIHIDITVIEEIISNAVNNYIKYLTL